MLAFSLRRRHSAALGFEHLECRRLLAYEVISSTANGVLGNGHSGDPFISASGLYVAFVSSASNLVSGDTNGTDDIFVKNTSTRVVQAVSTTGAGVFGNGSSGSPSISDNGQYVVFASLATNLQPVSYPGKLQIFRKDILSGAVQLVSENGIESGNQRCSDPIISGDGRWVAFSSDATNLVNGDTNNTGDVFVKDMQTGALVIASKSSTGSIGNRFSVSPSISADGRFVAFESFATNLTPNSVVDNLNDIFVKDLQTGAVQLASATSTTAANGVSFFPLISPDGTFLAFNTTASNLVADDTNNSSDVILRNLSTGVLTRVSESGSRQIGNGDSYVNTISANGDTVSFLSFATNLVPSDLNNRNDIFVKKTSLGGIWRATSSGVESNGNSDFSSITADGKTMVFDSEASNLIVDDYNVKADVFSTAVNQNPISLALSSSSLQENLAAGTIVGTLTTEDPDTQDSFTYSLVNGPGADNNSSFFIQANRLRARNSLNFEAQSTYSARLRSTDAGGFYIERAMTIQVIDVNESPTDIALSVSTLAENSAPGSVVGQLSSVDPDLNGQFTYALVSGTGSTGNAYFSIDASGNLIALSTFDFEQTSAVFIRVRTQDQGGLTFEKQLSVSILDLPEVLGNVVFGDGTSQRSLIQEIKLQFDSPVVLDSGAFTLQKRGGGFVTTQATQSTTATGQQIVSLTFSGSLTRGLGALEDGYYQLTIDGTKIRRGTNLLDFNQDGIGGDTKLIGTSEADNFFALFGDVDGDGLVSIAEFGQFRNAFGKTQGSAGYSALFDYDMDSAINIADFGQFRSRFGRPKLQF